MSLSNILILRLTVVEKLQNYAPYFFIHFFIHSKSEMIHLNLSIVGLFVKGVCSALLPLVDWTDVL